MHWSVCIWGALTHLCTILSTYQAEWNAKLSYVICMKSLTAQESSFCWQRLHSEGLGGQRFPASKKLLTVLHQSPGEGMLPPGWAGPSAQPSSPAHRRLRGHSPTPTVSTSFTTVQSRCSAASTEVWLCRSRSQPAKQHDWWALRLEVRGDLSTLKKNQIKSNLEGNTVKSLQICTGDFGKGWKNAPFTLER